MVIAGAISCAPAVTSEALDSPLQVAVGTYYALLAGEIDAPTARDVVGNALATNPSDHAVRIVLAQVELRHYSTSGSPPARHRLLGQLVALDVSLPSGSDVIDWVEARLFVTLGDLLMHDARHHRRQWLQDDVAFAGSLWRALLLVDAADSAYRFAQKTSGGEPSRGLIRERGHAATAQVAARLAIIATIGDLTASPTGALGRLHAESLQFLDATLRSDGASPGLVEVPARAEVSLDPEAHVLGAAAFGVLATDTFLRLGDACAVTADQDALSALLDEYVERLWRAGRHAVLADTLGVEYDSVLLLTLLEGVVNLDQHQACRLAA